MTTRLTLASLLLLLAPATLAQETELPDLTPREFEIRGDLQISLPDLERQPLRGFAPPPRTYVVPADRQAHIAPYGQDLDQLPDRNLEEPPSPSLVRAQPRIGQIDLLMGRYFARIGRLTVNTGGLGVDLEYSGYTGFEPYGADAPPVLQDFSQDAENLTGKVGFTTGDAVQLNLVADGSYHQYDLTALAGIGRDHRTMHSLGFQTSVRSVETQPRFSVEAGVRQSSVSDPERGDATVGTRGQDETMFVGSGSIEQGPLRFEGGLAHNSFDAEFWLPVQDPTLPPYGRVLFDASVLTYQMTGAYRLELTNGELSIGAGLAGFNPSDVNVDGSFFGPIIASAATVGPVVDFRLGVGPATQLFARTEPSAEVRSLIDIFRTNPYIQLLPIVAPDVHLLDAVLGIEVQTQVIRFDVFGGARLSPNELYFARFLNIFYTEYDETSTVRVGANLTGYAPGDISISAGVEYRRARLTEWDRDVPYVAPLSGRVSVAVPFAAARGLLQASLYAEGARPTEVEGETAPAWADLSMEAHYRLAGRFGLLVRADRLAGHAEQWPGFPQPPATITAGVRAGW